MDIPVDPSPTCRRCGKAARYALLVEGETVTYCDDCCAKGAGGRACWPNIRRGASSWWAWVDPDEWIVSQPRRRCGGPLPDGVTVLGCGAPAEFFVALDGQTWKADGFVCGTCVKFNDRIGRYKVQVEHVHAHCTSDGWKRGGTRVRAV